MYDMYTTSSLLTTSLLFLVALIEADIWNRVHLWFVHFFILLRQGVPCNALKCLLNVDCLLCACFEVGNVVLGFAPVLGSASWNLNNKTMM